MDELNQKELVKKFFIENPDRDVKHAEVVDWLTSEYKKLTGKVFRDPDRQIRSLHQEGFLVKVEKGIYRYDSKAVKQKKLEDFSPQQKKEILEKDGYKCVMGG